MLVTEPNNSGWRGPPRDNGTISEAGRFSCRVSACRLHPIFMNQLHRVWRLPGKLSSTSGRQPPTYGGPRFVQEETRPTRANVPTVASLSFVVDAARSSL